MTDWWQKYKDSFKIQLRPAERTAYCRGCDKELLKGELMISTYSSRNRGQHIHFCLDCAEEIGRLVKEHKDKE